MSQMGIDTTTERSVYRESEEYLGVVVTADVVLDAQPVALSYDRATWMPAEWAGDPGKTRVARVLLTSANKPAAPAVKVYVKVTDNPEAPVMLAGVLEIA